jgi:hypothetical protein
LTPYTDRRSPKAFRRTGKGRTAEPTRIELHTSEWEKLIQTGVTETGYIREEVEGAITMALKKTNSARRSKQRTAHFPPYYQLTKRKQRYYEILSTIFLSAGDTYRALERMALRREANEDKLIFEVEPDPGSHSMSCLKISLAYS